MAVKRKPGSHVLYNKRLQPSKALVTVLAKDLNCFATALQGQARAKHLCS